MGFFKDLRGAFITIANADTGSGGLVPLSGSTNPLWYWGNHKNEELPVATFVIIAGEEGTSAAKNTATVRFIVWNQPASGATYIAVAEDMRDRIKAIMTNTQLTAQGVDAAPMKPGYRDLPPDNDGIIGLVMELEFFNGE